MAAGGSSGGAAMEEWLQPTRLIDSNHPAVVSTAAQITEGAGDDVQKALLTYFFVRDAIKFGITAKFDMVKASEVLAAGRGFCTPKATLFVALLRACRIPARMHMVSINMAVNSGLGMPDNVYGDHAYTEVFLDGQWVKLDSYVVDAPLFAAAQAKIAALGWSQGYGVHARGANDWDGLTDSFCQLVSPTPSGDARGAGQVTRVWGELKHKGQAGVTRDSPQTDNDFGVVTDMDDFAARVAGSPFALLRTAKFRVLFFFIAAGINRKIAAARAGK